MLLSDNVAYGAQHESRLANARSAADMMLYHTRRLDDPKQRVDQARAGRVVMETVEVRTIPTDCC
jgi:hypothetical protein